MGYKNKDSSIKKILFNVFIIAIFISIFSITIIIFSNWINSSKENTEKIAVEINDNIYYQVKNFLELPSNLNEANSKLIKNKIINFSDNEQWVKFFAGVILAQPDQIYSFSYGTSQGEYYGARRNQEGSVEVMVNDEDTAGDTEYYAINENSTKEELVGVVENFDPRSRKWYKLAQDKKSPTFSSLYKHFVIDDLSISSAYPIYNELGELEGVLGTHILLSDIGTYIKEIVHKYDGYAIIFEEHSRNLIANSMGISNYVEELNGTIIRNSIVDINELDVDEIYKLYRTGEKSNFFYENQKGNYNINIEGINIDGLNWVILSAVPESLFTANVYDNIILTVGLLILFLIITALTYNLLMSKLLKPIEGLLNISNKFASGDLTQRVRKVRNDEIGIISESFNKVADKMVDLINNLEVIVESRTDELYRANSKLEESREKLRLILDSSAEAIYGMDLDGNCTFCNMSCIQMLGYNTEEDLLGKNMHWQIHHTKFDGSEFPLSQCKIFKSIREGKGYSAEDEVFWKADGTSFQVEYHAYPQIVNRNVIGGVVTFMDITDRKEKEEKINYLSYYDFLTGFYNRRWFEENKGNINKEENLPLAIIFADINGLKLTNDVFGHDAGDNLIRKSAEIIKKSTRANDMIVRIGGDELLIIIPNTNRENVEKIISRIHQGFANERVEAIKNSISLGYSIKYDEKEILDEIMGNAENQMYKEKTMNRKANNRDSMYSIVESLHKRDNKEKLLSTGVSDLCAKIGSKMGLQKLEIAKLRRAGYLHNIGKIVLADDLLKKEDRTMEEKEKYSEHSAVGYRILNLFENTMDISEYIYYYHERWDGKGKPQGLKSEQIPIISRIIAVAVFYEKQMVKDNLPEQEKKEKAISNIKEGSGTRFDPNIVNILIKVVN